MIFAKVAGRTADVSEHFNYLNRGKMNKQTLVLLLGTSCVLMHLFTCPVFDFDSVLENNLVLFLSCISCRLSLI